MSKTKTAQEAAQCSDKHCPFHGNSSVRGRAFTGTVVSTRMQNTAVIEWEYLHFVPKYERYERRKTRISVHNPDCIHALIGDTVTVQECRPIAKTKHHVITEKTAGEQTV